ncbi:hypothetical protein MRX96_058074 [Rhipicephalus microplus]
MERITPLFDEQRKAKQLAMKLTTPVIEAVMKAKILSIIETTVAALVDSQLTATLEPQRTATVESTLEALVVAKLEPIFAQIKDTLTALSH